MGHFKAHNDSSNHKYIPAKGCFFLRAQQEPGKRKTSTDLLKFNQFQYSKNDQKCNVRNVSKSALQKLRAVIKCGNLN